jgi:hypothetical protein
MAPALYMVLPIAAAGLIANAVLWREQRIEVGLISARFDVEKTVIGTNIICFYHPLLLLLLLLYDDVMIGASIAAARRGRRRHCAAAHQQMSEQRLVHVRASRHRARLLARHGTCVGHLAWRWRTFVCLFSLFDFVESVLNTQLVFC